MKLLPHSNGVRKVNMKKIFTTKEIIKLVAIIIVVILGSGFIFQRISNFIDKEKLKPKVDYTTVNDKRVDYRTSGQGDYTIVFDGAIGGNLEAWTPIVDELKNQDIQSFVYNRRGYGYSDSGSRITPEDQAKDLKILLRKAGVSEPFILVGEEYGSLVLTSFAKQFPDSVAGIVLIDPIVESDLKTKEFSKSIRLVKLRRMIENIGSEFGLTTLLDKLNIDVEVEDFENSLTGEMLEEFSKQRTKNDYTSAVYNEITNLVKGESSSQQIGMFAGKPYYLLTRNENSPLVNLGDEEITKVHITTCEKKFLSLTDTENVVNGINYVLKEISEIERRENR